MPGARIEVFWTWSFFTQRMQIPYQKLANPKKSDSFGFQSVYPTQFRSKHKPCRDITSYNKPKCRTWDHLRGSSGKQSDRLVANPGSLRITVRPFFLLML